MILEDDNIVSPLFFIWVKEALAQYFYNPQQHDPRLFGIGLQNQHMIAGRYPKKPAELLSPKTHLYKYQLLSTWGPIFFAAHWANFLSWQSEKASDPNFMPLFSNMITNKWFLERGGGRSVWSAWFIRYCAERGIYMLYTNFEGGEALVVNHRDSGKLLLSTSWPLLSSPLLFVVVVVDVLTLLPSLVNRGQLQGDERAELRHGQHP